MSQSSRIYKRPPITEAIIAFRSEPQLDERDTNALRDEFSTDFPTINESIDLNIRAEIAGKSSIKKRHAGYHLKDITALRQIIVGRGDFSSCILAPYPGWEGLEEFALSNLRRFRSKIGYRKIGRIGVRFLNRLDIKSDEASGKCDLRDFLTLSPEAESDAVPYDYDFFHYQTRYRLPGQRLGLVQVGNTDPALIGHASFMIDIDISIDADVPQNFEAIEAELRAMRSFKNEIFECMITDNSRDIFDREEAL